MMYQRDEPEFPRSSRVMSRGSVRRYWMFPVLLAALAPSLIGLQYYLLPIGQRVRHPFHIWFKPSGYIGQSAGILTLALFLFMYLYPLRKRVRMLAFGSQARWLEVHIAAGLLIPIVGATHAGWRFQGLIGLGYLAMLMVSLSGVLGRYIYIRMPRSPQGVELSDDGLRARQQELESAISELSGESPVVIREALSSPERRAADGHVGTIRLMVSNDIFRRRTVRRYLSRWGRPKRLDRAARRQMKNAMHERISLGQQRRMRDATRRLFGYWHVIHRPFSVASLIAVFIHVVVVVTLGVTWF